MGFISPEPSLSALFQMMPFSVLPVGAVDVFLETERKDLLAFSPEERKRAVEPYPTTSMTTAEVVEHLGYPTRQCLERRLARDPRYAGRMRSPIFPLETRRKTIEPISGGMRQKQAVRQPGVDVGAVAHWVKAYREGGMAALPPRNRNAVQDGGAPSRPRRDDSPGDDGDVEAPRRGVGDRS